MNISKEQLGRELARQIHMLAALKDEKKEATQNFKMREQAIEEEINRLALDVRKGQSSLYPQPESR